METKVQQLLPLGFVPPKIYEALRKYPDVQRAAEYLFSQRNKKTKQGE